MNNTPRHKGVLGWCLGVGFFALLTTAISVGALIASFMASHYSEEVILGFAFGIGFGIIAALLWTAVALIPKGKHKTAGTLVSVAGVICFPSGLLLIALGVFLRTSKKLAAAAALPSPAPSVIPT